MNHRTTGPRRLFAPCLALVLASAFPPPLAADVSPEDLVFRLALTGDSAARDQALDRFKSGEPERGLLLAAAGRFLSADPPAELESVTRLVDWLAAAEPVSPGAGSVLAGFLRSISESEARRALYRPVNPANPGNRPLDAALVAALVRHKTPEAVPVLEQLAARASLERWTRPNYAAIVKSLASQNGPEAESAVKRLWEASRSLETPEQRSAIPLLAATGWIAREEAVPVLEEILNQGAEVVFTPMILAVLGREDAFRRALTNAGRETRPILLRTAAVAGDTGCVGPAAAALSGEPGERQAGLEALARLIPLLPASESPPEGLVDSLSAVAGDPALDEAGQIALAECLGALASARQSEDARRLLAPFLSETAKPSVRRKAKEALRGRRGSASPRKSGLLDPGLLLYQRPMLAGPAGNPPNPSPEEKTP